MDDILARCVLVHHHRPLSSNKDLVEVVDDAVRDKGYSLDKVVGCNSNTSLAVLKDQKDVKRLLKSRSTNADVHFDKLCIIEDIIKLDVCAILLSDVITEVASSLDCREFHQLQKTSTRDGGVLLTFDDLSENLHIASTLTDAIEEYLRAVHNAGYRDFESKMVDTISQSFVVTGFPAASSSDKIQIALQRTKSGGGEVECIHPVGSMHNTAIAIFAESHVADKLKDKREITSDRFPNHILYLKPLTDYGDLGRLYIQVKGFNKYGTMEKTKEKLTINLQQQSVGGGDVKAIIYPVGHDEDVAIVEFHDSQVADNFLRTKMITAKDGAVIHFKNLMSLVKYFKKGAISQVSDSVLQIFPEIKRALNEHEGNKWTCIADNKYLFYTTDYLQELRSITEGVLLDKATSYTYRQNDVKRPPKDERNAFSERSHSPPPLTMEGASGSGWNSNDAEMTEGSCTSEILIDDMECNLLKGTKLIIRHGDITNEDVDVIVNAANGNLQHFGGVALAIAQRAGSELEKEGYDIIQQRGHKLLVNEVVVTKGYNLKAKHVIHAVGPNKRESGKSFRRELLTTFFNCLEYANSTLNAKTIALPLISSGICGGDIQECAEELSNALIAFQHKHQQPRLMEIRIVSNIIDVTFTIQDTLKVFAEKREPDQREEGVKKYVSTKRKGNDACHLNSGSHKQTSRNLGNAECCLCKRSASLLLKLDCNHDICDTCLSRMQKNHGKKKCPKCKTIINSQAHHLDKELQEELEGDVTSRGACALGKNISDSKQQEKETCVICLDDLGDDVRELPCKHKFCQECIDQAFKVKPVCPSCGMICGEMKGDQPPGTMHTVQQSWDLPDYAGHGTIEINYKIPSGKQTEAHPSPGSRFQGTHRTAYLPNNAEGKQVARLLRRAFDAGLIFTVGTSTTSGSSNVVTWNDIHHKTNTYGGPEKYGYPDPTYLKRVKMELSAKGIE